MLKHAKVIGLLAAAAQAHALTLGAAQGQVVIGRPLELIVMAGAGESFTAAEHCLQAEVHYGDSRLPAAVVTLTALATDESGTSRWRVRANQPVNEPIVTLQMRLGCSSSYTRSYALLADQDLAAPPAPRMPETAMRTPRSRALSGEMTTRAVEQPHASTPGELVSAPINLPPPRPRPAGVERALAKTRPVTAPKEVPGPAVAEKPALKPAVPASTGPRLELDLIETAAPALQTAGGGTDPLAGSLAAPAAAAASDSVDGARAKPPAAGGALQAELEGLRAEQVRMRAAIEAVNAQLAQARAPRWQDPLVLGLLGVSTASLLALAWTWIRIRRQHWA